MRPSPSAQITPSTMPTTLLPTTPPTMPTTTRPATLPKPAKTNERAPKHPPQKRPHVRALTLEPIAPVARRLGLSPGDARLTIPAVAPGQCIGLFGGSFDPPHAGHVHAAHLALTRLGLDQLWWMVTPVNPLKHGSPPSDLKRRLDAASTYCRDPRIRVTAFEARLGVTYTARVLHYLRRARPNVRFVWIMGGDNLLSFHRWQDWRWMMASTPVAIVDRPSAPMPITRSRAAAVFAGSRLMFSDAALLTKLKPPAWVLLRGPLNGQSSTELRALGQGL